MFDLKGKKALVTGSSQGIGKEIAKVLADSGAKVYVHGTNFSDKLEMAKHSAIRNFAKKLKTLFLQDI